MAVLAPYHPDPVERGAIAQTIIDAIVAPARSRVELRLIDILTTSDTSWWLSRLVEEMDHDDPPPSAQTILEALRALQFAGKVRVDGRKWCATLTIGKHFEHTNVDGRVLSALKALPTDTRVRAAVLARRASVPLDEIGQSLARLRVSGLVRKHQRSWSLA